MDEQACRLGEGAVPQGHGRGKDEEQEPNQPAEKNGCWLHRPLPLRRRGKRGDPAGRAYSAACFNSG